MASHLTALSFAASIALAAPAHAACPMALAVYAEREGAASIDFRPAEGATIANAFRMILPEGVMLDGIVQWSDEPEPDNRPYGMLMHNCPDGDATAEELAGCLVWQGVIYGLDANNAIELLPGPDGDAPARLLFPDLAPTLLASAIFGSDGLEKAPWDVFELSGCQE